MVKLKSENFITIQGWMINDLNLKGNELIAYATIYGFSQADNNTYNGSREYLSCWTNGSIRGIQKNLNSLVEKGYIKKVEEQLNGVKFCKYYAVERSELLLNDTHIGGEQSSLPVNKVPTRGEQSSLIGVNKVPTRGEQSSHNNIDYTIEDNIEDIYIEEPPSPTSPNNVSKTNKIQKHKYGEYKKVSLTKDEYDQLASIVQYPNKLIAILDEYIEINGKKYKNHFLMLKSRWPLEEYHKRYGKSILVPKQANQQLPKSTVSDAALDSLLAKYEKEGI